MSPSRQLRVRLATAEDATDLAPRLRVADVREIRAATGETCLEALRAGLRNARPCYALTDAHDRPLALFGVTPDRRSERRNAGIVWLMGADLSRRHEVEFLRGCREWIDRLQADYEVLWNRVDARNEAHLRWLKWCGFSLDRLIAEHGVEGRAFWEVSRRRSTPATIG